MISEIPAHLLNSLSSAAALAKALSQIPSYVRAALDALIHYSEWSYGTCTCTVFFYIMVPEGSLRGQSHIQAFCWWKTTITVKHRGKWDLTSVTLLVLNVMLEKYTSDTSSWIEEEGTKELNNISCLEVCIINLSIQPARLYFIMLKSTQWTKTVYFLVLQCCHN